MEPTSGSAKIFGFDKQTQGEEIRAQTVALALLEHSGVYEHMSAEDNLEFFGRAYRMPTKIRQARIKELFTNMDLWDRCREAVGKLSRGMKQHKVRGDFGLPVFHFHSRRNLVSLFLGGLCGGHKHSFDLRVFGCYLLSTVKVALRT